MLFKVSNNEESVLSISTYFAIGIFWGYWRKGIISPSRVALDLGLSIRVTWGNEEFACLSSTADLQMIHFHHLRRQAMESDQQMQKH